MSGSSSSGGLSLSDSDASKSDGGVPVKVNPMTMIGVFLYEPSLPIAIFGSVVTGVALLLCTYKYLKRRAWFLYTVLGAAIFQFAGLLARAFYVRSQKRASTSLISFAEFSLLVSPLFLSVACFQTFRRLVWWITPNELRHVRCIWFPVQRSTIPVALIYIGSSIGQFVGVMRYKEAYDKPIDEPWQMWDALWHGAHCISVGLILPLITFFIIAALTIRFAWISRGWTNSSSPTCTYDARWRRVFWLSNVSMCLLMVQTVYRMIYYSDGWTKSQRDFAIAHRGHYLVSHEWTFWFLDVLPILGVLFMFCFDYMHPGCILPQRYANICLHEKELEEAKIAEVKIREDV
ncbi:hypothetical protein M501DRAFT_1033240 [Patellaria atrata CBS 101060]|uniref:RTA1 domain protein n=1 Tax=Patellaria atrata CBS 101060 TaxID=1346257 RepID=A0A9P4S878_9PEZI|nr:hypothetical protein M501DRAFT_1033240 [Patellaria atrata CBS 101060]